MISVAVARKMYVVVTHYSDMVNTERTDFKIRKSRNASVGRHDHVRAVQTN